MNTPSPNRCHQLALLDSLKEKIARANVALLILGNFDNEPELQAALDLIREIEEGRNALHRSLLATPDPAPAPANSDEQYSKFLKGRRTHIARFAKRLEAGYNVGDSETMSFIDDLIGLNDGLSCFIEEFKPLTHDECRWVISSFLQDISNHFGYPFNDEYPPELLQKHGFSVSDVKPPPPMNKNGKAKGAEHE